MAAVSELCEVARGLAQLGYRVFPCRERGKAPLTRNGFKDAIRDERAILHWWERWPAANVGIACGASGIVVVDIDPKAGADPAELLTEFGDPGELVIARTGEAPPASTENPGSLEGVRGAHIYFRGEAKTGPTRWPGVELRAKGAYVIAPGSRHPSGVPYEWATGGPRPVGRLPEAPAQLGERGDSWPRAVGAPPASEADVLRPGGRHHGLLAIANSLLARQVYEPDLLLGALLEANRVRCDPPGGQEHVRAIARWAADSDIARAGRAEQELARRLFQAWRDQERGRAA